MAPGRSRGLTKRAGFWHSHAIPPQLRIYSRSLPILALSGSVVGFCKAVILSCCSVPLFTVFNVSWTMRFDSGVCVKKISWLGWLCWWRSQTTIYVILSDIVLWSIFVFRFIFLLKQNYLSRGCFCLLHYRDHHLCRTLQFTKKCICFTICWCRNNSISQHNTTLVYYIMQH